MKRRDFIRKVAIIGSGAAAGSLIIPSKANGLESRVSGRIIDTLSEEPVENAKLKFYSYPDNNLINECETDSDGFYSNIPTAVEGISWRNIKNLFRPEEEFNNLRKDVVAKKAAKTADSNLVKVEISHDDYYDAVRYVDLSKCNEFYTDIIPVHDVEVFRYTGPNVGEIDIMDFMEIFDMWCRDVNGQTQRWEEQPKWYINTSPAMFSGKEVTQDKIDLVREIIQNDLAQFSNGFISNPYIEEGRNPPLDVGWIRVYWRDDGGPGYHGEDLDGNIIVAAGTWFSTNWFERDVYLEELTQVLGARGASETRYFWNENGQYLPVGYEIGKILFKRKIGSRSHDIDPEP